MKSATKTFCIIWGILSLIVVVALFVIASTLAVSKDAAAHDLVQKIAGMTWAEAKASVESTTAMLFIYGGVSFATAIYSFVLSFLVYSEKLGKVPGIVMGAIAIVIGALVPGILFIIDSARSRGQVEEKPEETATETK